MVALCAGAHSGTNWTSRKFGGLLESNFRLFRAPFSLCGRGYSVSLSEEMEQQLVTQKNRKAYSSSGTVKGVNCQLLVSLAVFKQPAYTC